MKTLKVIITTRNISEELIQAVGSIEAIHFDNVEVDIKEKEFSDFEQITSYYELDEKIDSNDMIINAAKDTVKSKTHLLFQRYGYISLIEEFEMKFIHDLVEASELNEIDAFIQVEKIMEEFRDDFVKLENSLANDRVTNQEVKSNNVQDEITCSVMNNSSKVLNDKISEHQHSSRGYLGLATEVIDNEDGKASEYTPRERRRELINQRVQRSQKIAMRQKNIANELKEID